MIGLFKHIIVTTLLLLICIDIKAQNNDEPFGLVRIYFSYQLNTNQNYFHDYWTSDRAWQLDLETPFYIGEFSISGRYARFSEQMEVVPGIDNYQFSVSWGLRKEIIQNVKVGATIGSVFSIFRYDILTDLQKNMASSNFASLGDNLTESEIGFLVSVDISYDFAKNMGIRIQANRSKIYTKKKIKLNYIGIGIYRNFETPDWLKQILK